MNENSNQDSQIVSRIAQEVNAKPWQIQAAVNLLDEGATVPFIARYRKEKTGSLDDTQLRLLQDRLSYHRGLEERREVILRSVEQQGKLTEDLRKAILEADNKQRLEDLYLPYRPKRRTRATMAKEAGLEPLADSLFQDPSQNPNDLAQRYIKAESDFDTVEKVLNGARDMLVERFSEDSELLKILRQFIDIHGVLKSHLVEGKEREGAKFKDYFDFTQRLSEIPSHRALALFRGNAEGVLSLAMCPTDLEEVGLEQEIANYYRLRDLKRPADAWLQQCCRWAWRVKLQPALEVEAFSHLREQAENEAIKVFGINLHDLLLASPAGQRVVMGLDPGIRTGVKVAVVGRQGDLLETAVIYPFEPHNRYDEAKKKLITLCETFHVELISIGNGTASRETDKLAGEVVEAMGNRALHKVVVSEAGASVYSASELAAQELPDVDVSYRGAISIARRLQDPLAELVKIEPKAIGVGQYQHDVNQVLLTERLDAVVEDCVNAVGVNVNTASVPLLQRISGLSRSKAQQIVDYRTEHGEFKSRNDLKDVHGTGPKTYQQCAGFLRIMGGVNALDASAVHPESYDIVDRIAASIGLSVSNLIGNSSILHSLNLNAFITPEVGLPTLMDIVRELEKPGRDPRPEFSYAKFDENVHNIEDLVPGMVLEGAVTNVAQFGAFVDIGVHQDALVHISQLSERFVKDPHDVVKVGDIVRVKVLDVDLERHRISLTMKVESKQDHVPQKKNQTKTSSHRQTDTAMSRAFAGLISSH